MGAIVLSNVLRSLILWLLMNRVVASTKFNIQKYPIQEHWFNATIDHFNFRPTTVSTFPLRYFVNEENYEEGGPVFFYAGNEADITQFVKNSGFMFEAAAESNAMVVFAEHRYYGLSNPFGDEYALGKGYNVSFLSVEQAMQDFNTLNLHIRDKWNMTDDLSTPFILFGGSYGGNLAMWIRLKHPNLWAGAIASSVTPLKHLLRETNGFTRIETEAYANVSKKCPDLVREGWDELYEQAKTQSGRENIGSKLHLCESNTVVASNIHGWISNALETMVQYGYPYPTNFYNPVPGFPFKVACEKMLEASTGLGALYAAASVYYNYTGQAGSCFDFGSMCKESNRHWMRHGRYDWLAIQQQPTLLEALSTTATTRRRLGVTWEETDRAWGYQTW
jgi:lysosomal Pro-X carboxypeptidase